MLVNNTPVKVDINIETSTVTSEAFFSACFIIESETAPRSFVISKLSDLIDLGFARVSIAYNVAYSLLVQRKMTEIHFRSKRKLESYVEAYDADDNSSFYYISIESKGIVDVLALNDHIQLDTNKLQFFSTTEDVSSQVLGRRLVYYYQDEFTGLDIPPYYSDGIDDYWLWDNEDNVTWDNNDRLLMQLHDMDQEQAQARKAIYPEMSWIGYCGWFFPSRIQWLHKRLVSVDANKYINIPNLSSTTSLVMFNSPATSGSGTTCQGIPINFQVSLDWLVYAISKRMWNILYNTPTKINTTRNGLSVLENSLVETLDFSVTENIFTEYKIISRSVDRITGKASFKFSATLLHSILGVDKVEGTIYH
ncbi:MAG: hypothetical protein RR623_01290 [Bacilli bacterium]